MLERFRTFWQTVVLAPFVRLFLRLGISPDMVSLVGTLGVATGALVFFPQGWLWQGVLVITAFVFSDLIDGQMARQLGRHSAFGAFWDSTLDRVGDAAVFGGLALYFAGPGNSTALLVASLACLVLGNLTSYARTRAESLGFTAQVGIAERADRLVSVLVLTFFADLLGWEWLLALVLWVLVAAGTVTVLQRVRTVWQQAAAAH